MANIFHGDCLDVLPTLEKESVNCVVTSPPYYGLRDYGEQGQLGQEDHPTEYIEKMVEVFRLVREVLRPDGTVWLNLGDSYSASGRGGEPTRLRTQETRKKQRISKYRGRMGKTTRRIQPQELAWDTVESCVCPTGGWVVLASRYYLE